MTKAKIFLINHKKKGESILKLKATCDRMNIKMPLFSIFFKYQNDSYEITINGFQARNINEIRNVIFGLRYGKPSSALRPNFLLS